MDGAVLFLVCNSQVTQVVREDRLSGDYPTVARALLDRLKSAPLKDEKEDGYQTAVPDTLSLTEGRDDDPKRTLRLSVRLAQLPDYALGQLVCTFSSNLLAGGPVVLGGKEDAPPRRFTCTSTLLTQAGAEPDTGVPL
jgi:hypothetical protein